MIGERFVVVADPCENYGVEDEMDARWDAPLTQEQWAVVAWIFQSAVSEDEAAA
jgi:hypothetical protein